MSYVISILKNNIPSNDKEAISYLFDLESKETDERSKDLINLIEIFKQKFPCICDLPDDRKAEGVWSDGPLTGNVGTNIATIGILTDRLEEVLPFIVDVAIDNGFVVFDSQTDEFYRHKFNLDSEDDMETINDQIRIEKKKSFWSRLFGW